MGLLDELWPKLKPRIVGLIQEVQAQSVGAHDLAGKLHTGTIADSQGPQFLKTDGSRTLTGNQTVADGITFDGVDVSAHKAATDTHAAATAAAGHAGGVGAHTHQSTAQGGRLDHGLALTGLGDDDHPQYLNTARHDTPERHTLGTVVPHDTHALLGGLGADDHPQYLLVDGSRPMSGHLLPGLTDTYDLGSSSRLWRKGWLSELDAVLFAKNTATLVGGWLVVGKNEGTLAADVAAADTQIDFGQAMTAGDFVLFRAALAVEYMQIGALVSGTIYAVTRDLDGSGANAWAMGTPYAVLGQDGAGRIELNAYDTPRISIFRQGATYNVTTEPLREGDMNGWGDFTTEEYGIGIGNYAVGNYLRYGPSKGFKLKGGNGAVSIDENGINIQVGHSLLASEQNALDFTDASGNILSRYFSFTETGESPSSNTVLQAKCSTTNNTLAMFVTADASLPSLAGASSSIIQIASDAVKANGKTIGTHVYLSSIEDKVYAELGLYDSDLGSAGAKLTLNGLSVNGSIISSGGVAVGMSTVPSEKSILIATRSSSPAYNSGGMTMFSRNQSLYTINPSNYPISTNGASQAGFLAPLTFYGLRGCWLFNRASVNNVWCGADISPNRCNLTLVNATAWGTLKGLPGRIYATDFNGTSSYAYTAIGSQFNTPCWWSFGGWFHLDTNGVQHHGIMALGSDPLSCGIYIDKDGFVALISCDSSGVATWTTISNFTKTGWTFIGASYNFVASGNNTLTLRVDDTVAVRHNIVMNAPRTPVGNFQIGNAFGYWLDGKTPEVWFAGEASENIEDYYAATRGYFQY